MVPLILIFSVKRTDLYVEMGDSFERSEQFNQKLP